MHDGPGRPDLVYNDIPDMNGIPLRRLILSIAADYLAEDGQRAGLAEEPAGTLMEIFARPRNEARFVEGLQHLSVAFSASRNDGEDLPEEISQVQWNRYMRDQSERLRAASLTLGSGHGEVAKSQLDPFVHFIGKHFEAMKA